ncbi:FadR/GntR family transcriptional regulator [Actinomadura violacea]|uniref:FadR family transcriptional regulator n=1 Tax=Actinomadura violacea TaxID=2819934 RepID=A0ABS3S8T6_9ACTN|nr:FCD domain-containing protein [Actinomadura violacea]MBO2465412.1 FadR family transcriptional regulator [Actinomadura violacea]
MVRRSTLADEVVQEIITRIETLGLGPGDEIPPEGELAREFGVNRLVVREAIRTLVAREILVSSQGRPSRVSVPSARVFGQILEFRLRQHSLGLHDLTQTRNVIEGELARLAARRPDGERDTTPARDILERQRAAGQDRARFIELDIAFHAAIAELAGNELLRLLLESLADVLRAEREASYDGRVRRGEKHALTLDAHASILDAIDRGDPDEAATAMSRHLRETVLDLAQQPTPTRTGPADAAPPPTEETPREPIE